MRCAVESICCQGQAWDVAGGQYRFRQSFNLIGEVLGSSSAIGKTVSGNVRIKQIEHQKPRSIVRLGDEVLGILQLLLDLSAPESIALPHVKLKLAFRIHVQFADDARAVAGPLKHIWQQVIVQFLMNLKPDVSVRQSIMTITVRVQACEHRGTRWTAGRLAHVRRLKPHRVLSQFVDVRCPGNRIAIARELDSQVVGGDQQNVEFVGRTTNVGEQRKGDNNESKNQMSHDVSSVGLRWIKK